MGYRMRSDRDEEAFTWFSQNDVSTDPTVLNFCKCALDVFEKERRDQAHRNCWGNGDGRPCKDNGYCCSRNCVVEQVSDVESIGRCRTNASREVCSKKTGFTPARW